MAWSRGGIQGKTPDQYGGRQMIGFIHDRPKRQH
jgi:hypothetical protein